MGQGGGSIAAGPRGSRRRRRQRWHIACAALAGLAAVALTGASHRAFADEPSADVPSADVPSAAVPSAAKGDDSSMQSYDARALQRRGAARLVDRATAVMPAIYVMASVSHRGDLAGALEVRLGGVASLGLGYDDRLLVGVNAEDAEVQERRNQWFRLGVEAGRWFAQQPALELTFERTANGGSDEDEPQVAELRAAASRSFCSGAAGIFDLTAGVGLWDMEDNGAKLSRGSLADRVRPYGGLAWTPPSYPRTSLLLEGSFGPSLIDGEPRLDWRLGWGARYQVFSWSAIDLVVRNRQDAGLAGSTVMIRLAARVD